MSDDRSIGVFDSGLGGLTVVDAIRELLPNESITYIGDTLRCPYGGRSKDAIREFTAELTSFLLQKNVKLIVIACNTVSSVALDVVKELCGNIIPVVGVVEPGCKAAFEHSADKRVGVIGTRGTIAAGAYRKGLLALDSQIEVFEKACPLLAPMVEEGFTEGPLVELLLQEYLNELVDSGVDTLVLGCTHYPLLKNAIHSVLGGRIDVLDSAWWTARMVKELLKEEGTLSFTDEKNCHYFATDLTDQFQDLAQLFLHDNAKMEEIDLHSFFSNNKK